MRHALDNVDHIIGQAAAIGEPGSIAGDQAQTLALRHRRRRHTGVEAQQVGDRPSRRACGSNRRRIGHQRQQIGAGWRGYVEPVNGIEHSCNERIKVERGELAVVDRLRHAPEVLAARADDQFVDQRIAEALNLGQVAIVLAGLRGFANGDL